MRHMLRRSSENRRQINTTPDGHIAEHVGPAPALLTVPNMNPPARRGSYPGTQGAITRARSSSISAHSERFILYGDRLNDRRVFRISLFMILVFVVVVLASLYRLTT